MKYAVAVTAISDGIGVENMLNITKPSLENYCNKTKSDLIIFTEPKLNIADKVDNIYVHPHFGAYNYLRFEKNQVYGLFDIYDKVLRLDLDIVINPAAPNYFELDDTFLYGTYESDKSSFNGGVILASKKHKEAFNISDIDFNSDLGILKEQNVLNQRVRELNIPFKDLGSDFNFIVNPSFEEDDVRRKAHFIHSTYIGNKKKLASMKRDIDFFYNKENRKRI